MPDPTPFRLGGLRAPRCDAGGLALGRRVRARAAASIGAALALAALGAPALADGLDRARVPATAHVVVHLDFEALRASRLFAQLRALDPDASFEIDLSEDLPMLGAFRPLEEVRSVTLWAEDLEREHAALWVHASDKVRSLLQLAQGADNASSFEVAGHTVLSWGMDEDAILAVQLEGASSGDHWFLLANDAALLASGLELAAGHIDSLASHPATDLAAGDHGGAILVAAGDGSIAAIRAPSQVAKLVQGFTFELGERDGSVYASLDLTTQSDRDARRVTQVLDGVSALAQLAADGTPRGAWLRRLSSGLESRTWGNSAHFDFRYSLSSLDEDLRALREER